LIQDLRDYPLPLFISLILVLGFHPIWVRVGITRERALSNGAASFPLF